jgi:hypothetical protein
MKAEAGRNVRLGAEETGRNPGSAVVRARTKAEVATPSLREAGGPLDGRDPSGAARQPRGPVSPVGGNSYSVPERTRRRVVEVRSQAPAVHFVEDGSLLAAHPALEGRRQTSILPGHRDELILIGALQRAPLRPAPRRSPGRTHRSARHPAHAVAFRGRRSALGRGWDRRAGVDMSGLPTNALERICRHLAGLKMPRALEARQATVSRLEQGEASALEAIEALLGEDLTTRETRRIKMALQTAGLATIRTPAG